MRASYRAAILWMAENDDTDWVDNGGPGSVTAALVADLFGKDDAKVRADLAKVLQAGLIKVLQARRKLMAAARHHGGRT